jgi:hypothetical protein
VVVVITWSKRRAVFRYPLQPAPRVAVLVPCFRPAGEVRVFPHGWNRDAETFAPQAIAATLPQLEALAGAVRVSHATIVLRQVCESRLSESERERLWQAFRVPSFEQIIGKDGTLFAFECEAHNGLHLESSRLATGGEEIAREICGCGRSTPRLLSGQRDELVRAVASYAR